MSEIDLEDQVAGLLFRARRLLGFPDYDTPEVLNVQESSFFGEGAFFGSGAHDLERWCNGGEHFEFVAQWLKMDTAGEKPQAEQSTHVFSFAPTPTPPRSKVSIGSSTRNNILQRLHPTRIDALACSFDVTPISRSASNASCLSFTPRRISQCGWREPLPGKEELNPEGILLIAREGAKMVLIKQLPEKAMEQRCAFFIKSSASGRSAQSAPAAFNCGLIPAGCSRPALEALLLKLARTFIGGCLATAKKPDALKVFEQALNPKAETELSSVHSKPIFKVISAAQSVPMPEEFDPANIDVLAVTWIKHIKDLLAQEPQKCSVQREADFWRELAAHIVYTKAQFQEPKVAAVVRRLREHGSLLSVTLDSLLKSLEGEAQKRMKWSSYLAPLAVYREQISARLNLFPESTHSNRAQNERNQIFTDLFATIGCLAEYSDYASVGRLTALFLQFADLISDEVVTWLSKSPSSLIIRNMDIAKEVLCAFKETFLAQRVEKTIFRVCPVKAPFVNLDSAVERIRDVHEMVSSRALAFTQISAHLPHGNSQKNIQHLVQLRLEMQNIPFIPQNLFRHSEESFDKVYSLNNNEIKSFESRLGILLEDVVADTAVSTRACEVIEVFKALKDRRHFRTSWRRACEVALALFQKEISQCKRKIRTALQEKHGFSRLSRAVPMCAQFVCLADSVIERMDPTPLLRLLPPNPTTEEATELIARVQLLKEKELRKWCEKASAIVSSMKPGLLRHVQHERFHEVTVVLDPSVVKAVNEGIVFKRLDKDCFIPDAVEDVLERWGSVKMRKQRLQQVCFQFSADLRKIPPVWQKLLDYEIKNALLVFSRDGVDVSDVFSGSLSNVNLDECLTWVGGSEVDAFVSNCEEAGALVSRAVRILHAPLERINASFVAFDNSDTLFPFDSRVGNHTLVLGPEWTAFYEAKREERFEKLKQIPPDLISESLDQLNEFRGVERVSELDEEWLEYSHQVCLSAQKGVVKLVENALKRLKKQLSKNDTAAIPLISFSLTLNGDDAQFTPSKEKVTAAADAIIEDILRYPALVPNFGNPECLTGNVTSEGSVSSLVSAIKSLLSEELDEAASCLVFFNSQIQRWGQVFRGKSRNPVLGNGLLATDELLYAAMGNSQRRHTPSPSIMVDAEVEPSEVLSKLLKDCEAVAAALRRLPSSFTFGVFLLDTSALKTALANRAGEVHRKAVEDAHQKVEASLKELETELQTTYETISLAATNPAVTPSDLFTVLREIRDSFTKEAKVHSTLEPLLLLIRVLKKRHALPAQVIFSLLDRSEVIPELWTRIKGRIGTLRTSISSLQDKEVINWMEDHETFSKRVALYVVSASQRLPNSISLLDKNPYEQLCLVRAEVVLLLLEEKEMLKVGSMLEIIQTPSKELERFGEVVSSLKTLWDLVCHITSCLQEHGEGLFSNFSPETLTKVIDALEDLVVAESITVKGHRLYEQLSESLAEWKRHVPLLVKLHSSAFRTRHWNSLLDSCRKERCRHGDHTLICIIESGVSLGHAKLKILLKQSEKENITEQIVLAVYSSWIKRNLPLRWNGATMARTWSLDVSLTEELIALAESDRIALHGIERDPASAPHRSKIRRWLANLDVVSTVFRDWLEVEAQWTEVIYSLHSDYYLDGYKTLHKTYLYQMAKIHCKEDTRRPYPFFEALQLMKTFLNKPSGIRSMLAELEGRMQLRIEWCCTAQPRLAVLSDHKIKQLLALEQNHTEVLKMFSLIAPGCAVTMFSDGEKGVIRQHTEVTGFQSLDGVDTFTLGEPFACMGSLDSYFSGLLDAVHRGMQKQMEDAWAMVTDIPRAEWCINSITQTVTLAAHLAFYSDVNTMFDQLENGNPDTYNSLHSALTVRIRMHAGVLRGVGGMQSYICSIAALVSLDVNDKKRISSLLTVELHHRDILDCIIAQKAVRCTDFAWDTQLRIGWDTEGGAPVASGPFGVSMELGREFVSSAVGIPIITTPETHRCRTMTLVAMRIGTCPALFGPSAVGKVEMVHDLAKTLAHHAIVLVCSQTFEAKLVGRVFFAASRLGAWLIVARCAQLSLQNSILVANHVAEILQLQRQQRTRAKVAVTLVKNQTGWQPLPAPLVSLCQPVCLVQASITLLAVTAFASFGMRNAKHLGTQLGAFYDHGQELLPEQSWGIPTLRTVLILTRARWKATNENEKTVVSGAIHIVHIASLGGEDLAVAGHLLRSLFSATPPQAASPIVDTIVSMGYSTGEGGEFGAICNRLVAGLALQNGICIIGPPGCGKTVMWKVAVTALGWPKATVLFPAASPLPAFHAALRAAKLQNKKMIVLDGTPAQWLDDLSLNLDERMANSLINRDCRLVVECEHLRDVSPSVVTRVGIVSIRGVDVGWLGVKDRWSQNLSKEFRSAVDFLCDTHLAMVFEWHRKYLATQNELSLLQTILSTIDTLLLRVKKTSASSVDAVFAVSVFWSILAQISTSGEAASLLSWWRREFPLAGVIQDPTNQPRHTFLDLYKTLFSMGDTITPMFERTLLELTPEQVYATCYTVLLTAKQRSVCLIGSPGSGRSKVLSSLPQTLFVEGSATTQRTAWSGVDKDRQVVVCIDDVSTLPATTKESVRESLAINAGVTFVMVASAQDPTFGSPRTAMQLTALHLSDEDGVLEAIAQRISEHFTVDPSGNSSPQTIALPLFVSKAKSAFSEEVQVAGSSLGEASVQFVKRVDFSEKHSVISMHRTQVLTKLQQRLVVATPASITSRSKLVCLWRYEVRRLVHDAFLNPRQPQDLHETLDEVTVSIFDYIPENVFGDEDDTEEDPPEPCPVAPSAPRPPKTYWVPISRGSWNTVNKEKFPTSAKDTLDAVSKIDKRNPSLCTSVLVKHITSVADCLMTDMKVTIITGPRGVGKHYVAVQAARLLKSTPITYEGDVTYLGQLGLQGPKLQDVLIVKESRVTCSSFYEELSALRNVKIIFICNSCTPYLQRLRGEHAGLFSICHQYVMRELPCLTKFELVCNHLQSERQTNSIQNLQGAARFIVKVHYSSTKHTRTCGYGISTVFDLVRAVGRIHRETSLRDAIRKKAVSEGLSKSRAATGQTAILEARLIQESSLAKVQAKTTERVADIHEKAKRNFSEHVIGQDLHKKRCDATAAESHKLNRVILQEQLAAKPFLEAASTALRSIDKSALSDLRSLVKPPPDVIAVCISVMIMTADGRIPKERTWSALKKTIQSPAQWLQQISSLDLNNLPPMQTDYVSKMINENKHQYQPNNLLIRSPACAALCSWLINAIAYHESRVIIRPKEEAAHELKQTLEGYKQTLTKMKEKSKVLKVAVDQAFQDLSASEDQFDKHSLNAEQIEARLGCAKALMDALGEDDKWSDTLQKEQEWGVGDVLLCAALVTHGGGLSEEARATLGREWITALEEMNLPLLQPVLPLLRPADAALWTMAGLPQDNFMLGSAMAATTSARHVLMIDPQSLGWQWLNTLYPDVLVASYQSEDYHDVLLKALSESAPVILTDVSGRLPVCYDALLGTPSVVTRNHTVKISLRGRRFTVRDSFKIFAISPLIATNLPMELLTHFNVVNFSVSEDFIKDTLLTEVMKHTSPEAEAAYTEMRHEVNSKTIEMQTSEESLLQTLAAADGELLDKPELLNALKELKQNTITINSAIGKSKDALHALSLERAEYESVVMRPFYLILQALKLEGVSARYVFSIEWFRVLFASSLATFLKNGKMAVSLNSSNLQNEGGAKFADIGVKTTADLYRNLIMSIEKSDLPAFAASLCLHILNAEQPQRVSERLLDVFMNGPTLLETGPFFENGPIWLSESQWRKCLALEETCGDDFAGLTHDIRCHDRWAEWVHISKAECEAFPGEWQRLSLFQGLLLIKCLRPDRLCAAVETFVRGELGKPFVTAPVVHIPDILEGPMHVPCILIWTHYQIDLLAATEAYCKRLKKSVYKMRGCEPDAEELLAKAFGRGGSVIVWDVQAASGLLLSLVTLLRTERPHDSFLFICAAEATEVETIPLSYLRVCRKICASSCSMQSTLQQSWCETNLQAPTTTRPEYKSLLFRVVFLHTVLQTRNLSYPCGFQDAPHIFGSRELATSHFVLDYWMEDCSEVPWEALKTMISSYIYGGVVSSKMDLSVLQHMTQEVMSKKRATQTDFTGISVLPSQSLESIALSIDTLQWTAADEVALTGLCPDALSLDAPQIDLCGAVRLFLQPEGGAEVPTADVTPHNLRQELPTEFELSGRPHLRTTPMHEFFNAELTHFNTLARVAWRAILNIASYPEVSAALQKRSVPSEWVAAGFETNLPLGAWVRNLSERKAFLKQWEERRVPPVVTLVNLLFRPKRFFFCVLADNQAPELIDYSLLQCSVVNKTPDKIDIAARVGVYVWGFNLVLCRWNPESCLVDACFPDQPVSELPVLMLRVASDTEAKPTTPLWNCTVFATGLRKGIVVTLPLPAAPPPVTKDWTTAGASGVLEKPPSIEI